MEVRNDDMTVNVNSGQLSISVAKAISILGQGGGPITIEQGDGTIQISTSGDLTINANTIAINGQSINLKGSKISGN
jgi:type VI secretion system secreted protein VgrG